MAPRLTPTGSRLEAAVATLEVARAAGVPAAQVELLEHQIKRAFAFLLRYQFSPGPTHLMPKPAPAGGRISGQRASICTCASIIRSTRQARCSGIGSCTRSRRSSLTAPVGRAGLRAGQIAALRVGLVPARRRQRGLQRVGLAHAQERVA